MEPKHSLGFILDYERERARRLVHTSDAAATNSAWAVAASTPVHQAASSYYGEVGSFYHKRHRAVSALDYEYGYAAALPAATQRHRTSFPYQFPFHQLRTHELPQPAPSMVEELLTVPPPSAQPRPLTVDSSASSSSSSSSAKPRRRQRTMTADEKRAARQCSVDGCQNYTIDRGLCFRHGGGKTCAVDGCSRSAKARGLCWRHGGSVSCSVAGCDRGAKSKGLCWSHGGGSKCSIDGCGKTIISKGLCWTHGGGKRCSFDGCMRPASESKHNFCNRHHAELRDGNTEFHV